MIVFRVPERGEKGLTLFANLQQHDPQRLAVAAGIEFI